jgi:hypothetical protein
MVALAYSTPPASAMVWRRRRAVAYLFAALIVLSAVWALGAGRTRSGSVPLSAPGPVSVRTQPIGLRVHLVQPGETLWTIARTLVPSGDIRPVVARLAAQLHGQPLRAGDRLVLTG